MAIFILITQPVLPEAEYDYSKTISKHHFKLSCNECSIIQSHLTSCMLSTFKMLSDLPKPSCYRACMEMFYVHNKRVMRGDTFYHIPTTNTTQ